LISPAILKNRFRSTINQRRFVERSRKTISEIIDGIDSRFLLIVGPCSIHDAKGAIEYAERLKSISDRYCDTIFIVMRVYFEKPRTTVGWKGLINDPNLNNSFCIEQGLSEARNIMLNITDIGLPIATEALDPIVPQYLHDLVSWVAVGARTTESQTHREMASGLSSVVGFKNSTDGNIEVAINAIKSSSCSHSFLGLSQDGEISVFETEGNNSTHIILRGGKHPNFSDSCISEVEKLMISSGLKPKIVVDCSHANSRKNHLNQEVVLRDIVNQVLHGNDSIKGCMIESNLKDGNQKFSGSVDDLDYGVSITDKCLDIDRTEILIEQIGNMLVSRHMLSDENITV